MSLRKKLRALCLLLVFCLLFSSAAAAVAEGPEGLEITFTRMDHSYADERGSIELWYDLAHVSDAVPGSGKINAALEADYQEYASDIQGLEEYLDMPDARFFYTMAGEVTFLQGGVLSLRHEMEWFMGGVHNSGWHGSNFDLETGERITMDVLLGMGADNLMDILRPVILSYAQLNGGWDQPELERIVSGYTPESLDYFVNYDGELVLCIPEYELGPGAVGPMLIATGLYYGGDPEPEEDSLLDILLSPSGGAAQGMEPQDVELDSSQRYEINIFLSNFVEQYGFYEYPGDADSLVAREADFAHRFCKCNRSGAIEYRDHNGTSYETLTLEKVSSLTDRFFGRELTEDMALTGYPSSEYSFYMDGRFWYMAADGEAYTAFAVADSVGEVFDGVYFVSFSRYDLDIATYFNEDGIARAYYELTPEEAASLPELDCIGYGAAVVTPYDMNGRATYRLLEYLSW